MRFSPVLFNHTEALLSELLRSTFPADLVVSRYFRQHRELGHADRGFIAETVYCVLRRKRSLSARCLDDATSRRITPPARDPTIPGGRSHRLDARDPRDGAGGLVASGGACAPRTENDTQRGRRPSMAPRSRMDSGG